VCEQQVKKGKLLLKTEGNSPQEFLMGDAGKRGVNRDKIEGVESVKRGEGGGHSSSLGEKRRGATKRTI